MGGKLSYTTVMLAGLATVACPYSDLLSSRRGIAISGGGGGADGPNALSFNVQPSSANAGDIITPAVQVTVRDSLGAPDTSFALSITVAVSVNPVGGNLSGTRSIVPVNGIALFGDLVIDRSGSGYVLQATAPGAAPASSTSFNILAP